MKQLNLIVISLLALSLSFTSCKKDEPTVSDNNSKVSGTIQNGSSYNSPSDSVYVYLEDDDSTTPFAKSTLSNGSFNIQLGTPSSSQLDLLANDFDETNITVSDKTAKGVTANFVLSESGNQSSLYYMTYSYTTSNASITEVAYVYCDRALSLKGTETESTETATFDVKFEKGWNMLYATISATSSGSTISYSTNTPASNLGLVWTTSSALSLAPQSKIMQPKLFK